jgi:hypothetical protein
MEKNFTKVNNFFRTISAIVLTVFLMLAVKKATAHRVLYYSPICFTQGSTATIGTNITDAPSGTYYHWQFRAVAGGSWTWLSNGINSINGRSFNVTNASQVSTVLNATADLVISNVGAPAYTTQLNNVEIRVIMTDGLDPQYNSFPGTPAWGAEEFNNAYEAKYIRLNAKPANESCFANCTGNVLVNNPAEISPLPSDYFGGFEVATGTENDNFSIPGTFGATSKAAIDIPKWTGGALASTPLYRVLGNADSMNPAFSAFAPHSGNKMLVASRINNAASRIWYRNIAAPGTTTYYGGQLTFKAWFAKVDATDACIVMEIKGATTQGGALTSFAGSSISVTVTGNQGNWLQANLTVMVPVNTYKQLEFSIHTCSNAITSLAMDDICLIEPGAAILPVALLPLQANYIDGVTHLQWGTEQESNSNYFEIETSTDGIDFVTAGKVFANGNSSRKITYKFDDVKTGAGINYYRLRIVDKDSRFVFSNLVSVNVVIKGIFVTGVYPSPFSDNIAVSISSDKALKAVIKLTDIAGRKILDKNTSVNKGITTIPLNNLGNLAKGVYIVTANCDGVIYTQKIIKQ